MTTKVSIVSHAFNYLGKAAINSFSDGDPLHQIASSLYDTIYPQVLTKTIWTFASTTQLLAQDTVDPVQNDWQNSFQLPTLPLYLQTIDVQPRQNFIVFGDKIYTNGDTVTLDYIFQPDENDLPPSFRQYLEYALAAAFAMPVTQDTTLANFWAKRAERQYLVALSADSRKEPNRQIVNNNFIAVHRL